MKFTKPLALAAAAAALIGMAPVAQAALIVRISDGILTLNIADGSVADIDAQAGGVGYFGAFGNWELAFALGTSTTDPLQMHLTSAITGNAGDGVLTISFTQTDLVASSNPTMVFGAGGAGYGAIGATGSWAAYVDDSNAAFGTGTTVFNSIGFNSAGGNLEASLAGTYSATLSTSFDYAGVSVRSPQRVQSSLDVGMHVPEPASMLLLGGGLLALGATTRRRKPA